MKQWFRPGGFLLVMLVCGAGGIRSFAVPANPPPARILFLGDSITYSGQYVEFFETFVRLQCPAWRGEILNLGLPSEMVSGLSEPGHAGGVFPRPDLHERLDRVLAQTKPDLVIACYGMNDGIYLPFDAERFQRFQDGIRWLREKVAAAGAPIILLTPPTFDPTAGNPNPPPAFNYNDVLDRYAEWLLAQRDRGWTVLDVHGPMNRFLAERRRQDPTCHLAGDGVHPDDTGHWLMAGPLLRHFGAPAEFSKAETVAPMLAHYAHGAEVLKLVQERQRMLKDAWLTATGHKRPGMAKGLPLAEAQSRAADLDRQIRALNAAPASVELHRDGHGRVVVQSSATNVIVRYTLDGSDPGRDAGPYLAPIELPWGGTVKAQAYGEDGTPRGDVATATLDRLPSCAQPRPPVAELPVTQARDWRNYDFARRHAACCAVVRARRPALVFLGDSITHFWGGEPRDYAPRGGEVWDRFYGPRNAVNLGFGWDCTENVLWRLQHGELAGAAPEVAVVLIGTNNLDRDPPRDIAAAIHAICAAIHARSPRTRVLLLGVLPRSAKPDDLRRKAAAVNALLARLNGRNGVTFLDVSATFLNPDGSISPDVMSDFLHPTAKGYQMLAAAIEPTLARLLAARPDLGAPSQPNR